MGRKGHRNTASLARYSSVEIRVEDWTAQTVTLRDGRKMRVEGYVNGKCPTDVCHAVCCRISDIYEGGVGEGPCRYLGEDELCILHKMDAAFKPVACMVWPKNEVDVAKTNELAERFGLEGRCQLKLVEVD